MLKGKTAVVTGGSRGIGEAVVYKLASMGADVAVIYAGNTQAAENVCNKCRQENNVQAKAYRCDVADFTAVKETVAGIKADFKTAHILVNNAGITRDGLLAMMKEEDYDAVLDTNLKGAFNMIRHMTGLFIRNREAVLSISPRLPGLQAMRVSVIIPRQRRGLSVLQSLLPRSWRPRAYAAMR